MENNNRQETINAFLDGISDPVVKGCVNSWLQSSSTSGIAPILDSIATACYARDVRDSIVAALIQIYLDGKAGSEDIVARNQIKELNKQIKAIARNMKLLTVGGSILAIAVLITLIVSIVLHFV